MVRGSSKPNATPVGSPHPRGDGPSSGLAGGAELVFSPPAWGWSGRTVTLDEPAKVLPTRVGMVRARPPRNCSPPSSPHPRGDGPPHKSSPAVWPKFSPPAWGWSGENRNVGHVLRVLPTRVGDGPHEVCRWHRSSPWRERRRKGGVIFRGHESSHRMVHSMDHVHPHPRRRWCAVA